MPFKRGNSMKILSFLFILFFAFQVQATVDIVEHSTVICVVPNISIGAHSVGHAVGGQMNFENAVGGNQKTGLIDSVTIIDADVERAAFDLNCFSEDFVETASTPPTAVSVSDSDAANLVLTVSIPTADYIDLGASGVVQVKNIGVRIKLSDSTLRCQLRTATAVTYTATNDIKVCIGIKKDSM